MCGGSLGLRGCSGGRQREQRCAVCGLEPCRGPGAGGEGTGLTGAEWAHLSCRSRAAVRQGRSSSACSISRAETASTRAGTRTTNSAVRGGLFQARNCGGGRDTVAQTGQEGTCWPWPRPMTSYCTPTQRHSVQTGAAGPSPPRPAHLWLL